MNRSDYKRLGNYIREVDVRNRDLAVTNLLGVSISKEFIPSIANTIGTDMSSYKVVRPNQFAYGPVTSRNGDKVSIALFHGDGCAIISQAYTVFEVQDGETLMPEYLMMWFRRPEFDRYARFHSHGSAREIFDWDEMCEVMLPVPSIERQRAMVAEYETLSRRIDLNRSMIAQLEATAQTLYRKMFVDDIDPEHLPVGWRMGTLGEVAEIRAGGDKPKEFTVEPSERSNIPVVANGVENNGIVGYTLLPTIVDSSVTISARGTIGVSIVRTYPYYPIVRLISVIPNNKLLLYNLWYQLSDKQFQGDGSVQNQLTIPFVEREDVLIPDDKILKNFDTRMTILHNSTEMYTKEITILTKLQSLLLAKMGQ
ncbi:restriction endonuclease subunit S [uncultured Alistipes sp.]|uniref:restriction endonuclease subunit S n=1 Tax=uncultured Alistipes sp. TaxID=538949 RepID=UPI0025EB493F|nr:restriction endonuclease subunit S [uncultured Alistipes sp.]